jgi:hypothetical protein
MSKKLVSLLLISLLFHVASMPCAAATASGKDFKKVEKLRTAINKLGTGPESIVEVKLDDKTKVKGYVSEIGSENFTVTESTSGKTQTVDYSKVKNVKGNNLSTGAKIAIGVGIGVGVVVLITVLTYLGNER